MVPFCNIFTILRLVVVGAARRAISASPFRLWTDPFRPGAAPEPIIWTAIGHADATHLRLVHQIVSRHARLRRYRHRVMRLRFSCLLLIVAAGFTVPSIYPMQGAFAQLAPLTPEREFADAYELFAGQLYRESIEAFDKFRRRNPDHVNAADALYYQAEASLAVGREDEAVALFRRLERLHPNHPLAASSRLALGKFFYTSEQYDRAIDVLGQVLSDDPGPEASAKALYWMGESALNLGQTETAINYFRRAADEYRDTETAAVALYTIGYTYVVEDQYDEAARAFEVLAARYPGSDYARNIGLALAEVYYELSDYRRVVDEINRRMPSLNREAQERARFLLAEAYNHLRESDNAIIQYRRFTEENPDSPYYRRALYGLAWNYHFEGAHQWAAEHFQRVREGHDDDLAARATYYEAVSQKLASRPERAVELFEEFVSAWPRHELAVRGLYELGVGYYEQRRWEEARLTFSRIVDRFPESELVGDALRLRANTAIAQGDFEQALENFDRAAELGAAPPELRDEVRFQRAWLQYRSGNYAEARGGFAAIYDAEPGSDRGQESLFWLAESNYQLGNLDQAAELFRRYLTDVSSGQHTDAAYYALGWTHFRRGNYAAAADEFTRFLDAYRSTGQDEFVPYRTDAMLRLADSYYAMKRYSDAVHAYRRVADQAGDYAYYQVAQAYYNAGNVFEAVSAFRELLEEFPESQWAEEARYNLGYAFFQNEDYDQAIEEYRTLIQTYPSDPLAAKAQYGIGDALFNAGRPEEAVEAYRVVLERYPRSPYVSDAAAGIQYALVSMGDDARASAIIDEFIAAHPNSPIVDELRFRKAEVFYQSGRQAEALREFQAFVRTSQNERLLPEAIYYVGMIYADQNQVQPAAEQFERVVNGYPNSAHFADAARRLGRLYLDAERPQDAMQVYRRLENAQRNDSRAVAEARYGQGMALIQLGRAEEAERLLQDAIQAAPDAPETLPAYLGLARVYENSGRQDEAVRMYRNVVERSRDEIGAEALFRLGALYRAANQPRRAVEELGRLPVLYAGYTEWTARGYLEQARAFRALGQRGDASRVYDRVITEYRGTPYAHTAQQEKEAL